MLRDSFRALIIKTGSNRYSLRIFYYLWRIIPYPARRLATALFIITVLLQKKLFKVDQQDELTPLQKLGTLAFWGVPEIDIHDYRLIIEGAVVQSASLSFEHLPSSCLYVFITVSQGTPIKFARPYTIMPTGSNLESAKILLAV